MWANLLAFSYPCIMHACMLYVRVCMMCVGSWVYVCVCRTMSTCMCVQDYECMYVCWTLHVHMYGMFVCILACRYARTLFDELIPTCFNVQKSHMRRNSFQLLSIGLSSHACHRTWKDSVYTIFQTCSNPQYRKNKSETSSPTHHFDHTERKPHCWGLE